MGRCQAPQALPLGLLFTTVGLGAVIEWSALLAIGALAVASLPERARRGRWLTAGNLIFPLLLIGFAASRSFVVSLALLPGGGGGRLRHAELVGEYPTPDYRPRRGARPRDEHLLADVPGVYAARGSAGRADGRCHRRIAESGAWARWPRWRMGCSWRSGSRR